MKRIAFTALLALSATFYATAEVTYTTNFVGTIAMRQECRAMADEAERKLFAFVLPEMGVQWETNVIEETQGEGDDYYVGPKCEVVFANWLASSTTNDWRTFEAPFVVDGHEGTLGVTAEGGLTLDGLEGYEYGSGSGYGTAILRVIDKHLGADYTMIKWRYYRWYNINGGRQARDCTMTLTLTPRWRFSLLPASP